MTGPAQSAMVEELDELQRQLADLRERMTGDAVAPDTSRPTSARAVSTDELPKGEIQLLQCQLGQDMVGFPLSVVKEVAPMAALTPMPESPPWVPGMLNLRGTPVPVLDVSARFERGTRQSKISDLIVICRCDDQPVGLLVPDVVGVQTFAADVARSAIDGLQRAPYLLGVLNFEGTQISVLSVSRLLKYSDLPESRDESETDD